MSSVFTITFSRAHTSTYVADHMRNILRDIVRYMGLNPADLLNDWETLGLGIRSWLRSGDLISIIIEFCRPGQSEADGRLDFPVRYDGSGVDDDLWVDKTHLIRSLARLDKVPSGCLYRVVLVASPGAPDIPGLFDTTLRSTGDLVRRGAGTLVATPDVVAGMTYWKRSR